MGIDGVVRLFIKYQDHTATQGYPDWRRAERAYKSVIRSFFRSGFQTTVNGRGTVVVIKDKEGKGEEFARIWLEGPDHESDS